ncbi:MurR/RpiR family transcriptional regulator [Streptococcus merionis]|uniref:MurR/RpiR family transcriptional regulator n=1 Tax=Streptococcus merionis TaxID=400065 RepID=UPI0035194723
MDFRTRVTHFYPKLNESDKTLVAYLMDYRDDPNKLTSQMLSDELFLSRSAIFRCLKKLEVDSFAELKYLLKHQEQLSTGQDDFDEVIRNYHLYIDQIFAKQQLQPIIDLLVSCDVIYLFGTGNEQKLEVEYMRQLFTSLGKKVSVIFDRGEFEYAKENFAAQDLFGLISYKGESSDAVAMLEECQLLPIQTLTMAQTSSNSMSRLADYQLYVPTTSIQTKTKFSHGISTTFYFIIDQLFEGCYQKLRGGQT